MNRIVQGSRDALRPRSELTAMQRRRKVAEASASGTMSDAVEISAPIERLDGRDALQERLTRIRLETSFADARAQVWIAQLKAEQLEQAEAERVLREGGVKARLAAVWARCRLPLEDR